MLLKLSSPDSFYFLKMWLLENIIADTTYILFLLDSWSGA